MASRTAEAGKATKDSQTTDPGQTTNETEGIESTKTSEAVKRRNPVELQHEENPRATSPRMPRKFINEDQRRAGQKQRNQVSLEDTEEFLLANTGSRFKV